MTDHGRCLQRLYVTLVQLGVVLGRCLQLFEDTHVEVEATLLDVSMLFNVKIWPQHAMQQSTCGVVFHDGLGCKVLIGETSTGHPSPFRCDDLQECLSCVLSRVTWRKDNLVGYFKNILWDS